MILNQELPRKPVDGAKRISLLAFSFRPTHRMSCVKDDDSARQWEAVIIRLSSFRCFALICVDAAAPDAPLIFN